MPKAKRKKPAPVKAANQAPNMGPPKPTRELLDYLLNQVEATAKWRHEKDIQTCQILLTCISDLRNSLQCNDAVSAGWYGYLLGMNVYGSAAMPNLEADLHRRGAHNDRYGGSVEEKAMKAKSLFPQFQDWDLVAKEMGVTRHTLNRWIRQS